MLPDFLIQENHKIDKKITLITKSFNEYKRYDAQFIIPADIEACFIKLITIVIIKFTIT